MQHFISVLTVGQSTRLGDPSTIAENVQNMTLAGADPGFLERGLIYIKVRGFALLILSHLPKYLMKMKYFGLTETKLFHFHSIFKNGGGEGVRANPLTPLWIRH